MSSNRKWDERFIRLAKTIAGWSKDPSSQIGAVIVGPDNEIRTTGFNGPPRGVRDDIPERWERPLKYQFCAHAEENAIVNAARVGVPVLGCTIFVSGLPPCAPCARMVINAGIKRMVVSTLDIPERWKESIEPALEMLKEADVIVWEEKPVIDVRSDIHIGDILNAPATKGRE